MKLSKPSVRRTAQLAQLGLAAALGCLLSTSSAHALRHIGGVDQETQYTASDNVLTFDDAFNGHNDPEQGLTTTSDVPAFIGTSVRFEIMLDTSGYDPATGDVRDAVFIGTGALPEMTFWQGGTVVLALDVEFISVTQAARAGSALGGPDGTILLGVPTASQFNITSKLVVAGGTLNQAVGGVGTGAVMELLMSSLDPQMSKALRNSGYLGLDFTNGVGTSNESATWNLTILGVPEPSTAVLVGGYLLGMLAWMRRNGRGRID